MAVKEIEAQQIAAKPGFAIYVLALRLQGTDIEVQRAQADVQFIGQRRATHRAPMATKRLEETE